MQEEPTIKDVRNFWEAYPLFIGESKHVAGTLDFFEEHRKTTIEDNLAGEIPGWFFPNIDFNFNILDLGCGPGFWLVEFFQRGYKKIFACDLTFNALNLSGTRCTLYNIPSIYLCQQNAEQLGFKNKSFAHINCQGVIHHTPNTEAAIKEIHRILMDNGTALISVYYKNIFLRLWPIISWLGKFMFLFGAKIEGRGRENIFTQRSVPEIVRMYDGLDNPIGKCYTRQHFFAMLAPYFEILGWGYHLFPARSLPLKIPKRIHRFLNDHFGFMLYVKVRKKALQINDSTF